jgi:hypothetical protein
MRKTRERKRKNLRLVTIKVPLNAYEAAKRGDFAGIITGLNAWFDQPGRAEDRERRVRIIGAPRQAKRDHTTRRRQLLLPDLLLLRSRYQP